MSKIEVKNKSVSDNYPDYKQTYVEGKVGSTGSYRINPRTGRIDFVKELFASDGERMPLKLSLVYDPYAPELSGYAAKKLPGGWKLNYEQFFYPRDNETIVYVDGDFREHIFKRLPNATYYDTEHTGLTLSASGSAATISDGKGAALYFENYKLIKMEEKRGSVPDTTTITYDADKTTVADAMGRTAILSGGANAFTLTLPGGRTVNFDFTDTKLTLTDLTGETIEYGFDNAAKDLTVVSGSFGDYADVAYDALRRVDSIVCGRKTNGEKYGKKKYRFVYGENKTDVSDISYPTAAGVGAQITTRYAFAVNGAAVGTCELTDDKIAAVSFVSEEEYRRYNLRVSSEEYAPGAFRIIFQNNENEIRVPVYSPAGNTASLIFTMPAWSEGSDFVLSFAGQVEEQFTGEHIVQLAVYAAGKTHNYEFRFDNVVGAQAASVKLGLTQAELDGNITFTMDFSRAGRMRLSGLSISKTPKGEEIECVSVDTGSDVNFYEIGRSTVWYELTDCKINGAGDSVVMNGSDWKRTLENYARRKDGSYLIWYNGLGAAVMGTEDTFFTFGGGSVHHQIGKIYFSIVTLRGTRKEFISETYGSGGAYVSVFDHGVYPGNDYKSCSWNYDENYQLVKTLDSNNTETTYERDEFGNVTKLTRRNISENLTTVREYEYGENTDSGEILRNGRYLLAERTYLNGLSREEKYLYDPTTGSVISRRSPEDHVTNFDYNADGTYDKIASVVATTINAHDFDYEKGRMDKIGHNGFGYALGYDDYGDVNAVRMQNGSADQLVMKKSFDHGTDGLTSFTYCEETRGRYTPYEEKTYNAYGQLTNVTKYADGMMNANAVFLYGAVTDVITDDTKPYDVNITKNADSKLRRAIDNGDRTLYTYTATGQIGRLEKRTLSTDYTVVSDYDDDERLSKESISGPGAAVNIVYGYADGDALNDDKTVSSVTKYDYVYAPSECTATDAHDKLGRLQSRNRHVVVTGYRGIGGADYICGNTYTYASARKWETTDLVEKETIALPGGGSESYTYSYDLNGNITRIASGNGYSSYAYDGLNRLVREDNPRENRTWIYEYDAGGNRRAKKEYLYTSGEPTGTSLLTTYAYDAVWKDRLTAITTAGVTETVGGYGGEGCPTSYRGAALSWQNRLLGKFVKNGATTNYEYKSDNVRLRKSGSVAAEFSYEGSKLLWERRDGAVIQYTYDHTGLNGFIYNNAQYLYVKNMQGDITRSIPYSASKRRNTHTMHSENAA